MAHDGFQPKYLTKLLVLMVLKVFHEIFLPFAVLFFTLSFFSRFDPGLTQLGDLTLSTPTFSITGSISVAYLLLIFLTLRYSRRVYCKTHLIILQFHQVLQKLSSED